MRSSLMTALRSDSQVRKPTEKISITIGTLSGLVMISLKLLLVIARPENQSVNIKIVHATGGNVRKRRKTSSNANPVTARRK